MYEDEDSIHAVAGAINGHDDSFYATDDCIHGVAVLINGPEGAIYGHDGSIHAPEDAVNEADDLICEFEEMIWGRAGVKNKSALSQASGNGLVLGRSPPVSARA